VGWSHIAGGSPLSAKNFSITTGKRIEHQVHKFLAEERRRGEWFDTPMDAVSLAELVVRAVQYLAEQTVPTVPQASEIPTVGQRIRSRREQLGLTQADLSRLIGVPQSRLSEYESGDYSPRLKPGASRGKPQRH
jgi:DNA-binding transcriptional regulator YiaG